MAPGWKKPMSAVEPPMSEGSAASPMLPTPASGRIQWVGGWPWSTVDATSMAVLWWVLYWSVSDHWFVLFGRDDLDHSHLSGVAHRETGLPPCQDYLKLWVSSAIVRDLVLDAINYAPPEYIYQASIYHWKNPASRQNSHLSQSKYRLTVFAHSWRVINPDELWCDEMVEATDVQIWNKKYQMIIIIHTNIKNRL